MGKVRIAQVLARAGLHLGASTVGRIIKEEPLHDVPDSEVVETEKKDQVVTARYANHVWHVDMTTVPTTGFWVPWTPFCWTQVWPFCWWVIVVIDHFSRAVVGFAVFKKQPTADEVIVFMTKTVRMVGSPPRHLISDQGSQFISELGAMGNQGTLNSVSARLASTEASPLLKD